MNINHFYPEMHMGLTKRPALNVWVKKQNQDVLIEDDSSQDYTETIHAGGKSYDGNYLW